MKMILMVVSSCGLAASGYGANEPQYEARPGFRQWETLFASDLSDAVFPNGVWSVTECVLTA